MKSIVVSSVFVMCVCGEGESNFGLDLVGIVVTTTGVRSATCRGTDSCCGFLLMVKLVAWESYIFMFALESGEPIVFEVVVFVEASRLLMTKFVDMRG